MITNKFWKKEKLLEKQKDIAKQKLSSKPAKAAETTETVEAAVQKSLTQKTIKWQKQKSQNEPFNKDHVLKRTWTDVSDSQLNNSDEN